MLYVKTALALSRVWHHTSASDRVLGKLAARIAWVLMGKHKATYDPAGDRFNVHLLKSVLMGGLVDAGDYVVVSDALEVKLTGKKAADKKYFFHSGYPGGEKWIPITRMRERHPDDVSLESSSLLKSR